MFFCTKILFSKIHSKHILHENDFLMQNLYKNTNSLNTVLCHKHNKFAELHIIILVTPFYPTKNLSLLKTIILDQLYPITWDKMSLGVRCQRSNVPVTNVSGSISPWGSNVLESNSS